MLIALPLALGLVAALLWRHSDGPGGKRLPIGVAAVALAVRLAAVLVIYLIARQVHDTGEWLDDESSFFKAAQSLLPNPLDRALPLGLEHLGGDAYLGLTTTLALLGGVADTNTFRVVNAALGAAVVVVSMLVARRLFGARAALVAGLGLALWPTLILWSATMLRDTMGSFAIVAVWWALGRARESGWIRTVGAVFLSAVIVLSLRPYLGGAMLVGVAAWALYQVSQPLRPRSMALLVAGAAVLGIVLAVTQARSIDYAAHELLYRQTVTRIETLHRLYTDWPPTTPDLPIRPGRAVGLVNADSGWILGGVVQDFDGPGVVRVAFTDGSIRDLAESDLSLLESTHIPPLQLVHDMGPNLLSYLTGTSSTDEPSSPVWMAVALASDVLLVLAAVAAVRLRLSPREWLFPLCVVGGTVLALVAIPGAPSNADRHRATQTVPLLLVLAVGLISARAAPSRASGVAVASITTRPTNEPTPASSRMRSAR